MRNNSTLTYVQYLRLDQVLSAQQPRSDRPDEMLFIVLHQVNELWFKQLLHELARLQAALEEGATPAVLRGLRRILRIIRIVVVQLEVLETLTPTQFISFRDWLEASSGFESAQFRELEAVLGRRDKRVPARYPKDSAERAKIVAAMSRPALYDSLIRYLDLRGFRIPPELPARDFRQPTEPSPWLQEMLETVYRKESVEAGVCELMVDLDESFQEWRYRHVKMVERTIGSRQGTAGSAGAAYLRSTVGAPSFPDLWAVRDRL